MPNESFLAMDTDSQLRLLIDVATALSCLAETPRRSRGGYSFLAKIGLLTCHLDLASFA